MAQLARSWPVTVVTFLEPPAPIAAGYCTDAKGPLIVERMFAGGETGCVPHVVVNGDGD